MRVHVVLALVALVTLGAYGVTGSRLSELLAEAETIPSRANAIDPIPMEEHVLPRLCYVDVQVIKRETGRCVKLGKSARGCVAGNYLHPFHADCM